jgi:hypothetical protein
MKSSKRSEGTKPMMLCKADFKEFFPHLFNAADRALSEERVSPNHVCISCWKDDGGSSLAADYGERAPVIGSEHGIVTLT